jgi:hypothetical protein
MGAWQGDILHSQKGGRKASQEMEYKALGLRIASRGGGVSDGDWIGGVDGDTQEK